VPWACHRARKGVLSSRDLSRRGNG